MSYFQQKENSYASSVKAGDALSKRVATGYDALANAPGLPLEPSYASYVTGARRPTSRRDPGASSNGDHREVDAELSKICSLFDSDDDQGDGSDHGRTPQATWSTSTNNYFPLPGLQDSPVESSYWLNFNESLTSRSPFPFPWSAAAWLQNSFHPQASAPFFDSSPALQVRPQDISGAGGSTSVWSSRSSEAQAPTPHLAHSPTSSQETSSSEEPLTPTEAVNGNGKISTSSSSVVAKTEDSDVLNSILTGTATYATTDPPCLEGLGTSLSSPFLLLGSTSSTARSIVPRMPTRGSEDLLPENPEVNPLPVPAIASSNPRKRKRVVRDESSQGPSSSSATLALESEGPTSIQFAVRKKRRCKDAGTVDITVHLNHKVKLLSNVLGDDARCRFSTFRNGVWTRCNQELVSDSELVFDHLATHYAELGYHAKREECVRAALDAGLSEVEAKKADFMAFCPWCNKETTKFGGLNRHIVCSELKINTELCPCGGSYSRKNQQNNMDRHKMSAQHQAYERMKKEEEARTGKRKGDIKEGTEFVEGSSRGTKRRRHAR